MRSREASGATVDLRNKAAYLEFKHLYFQLQKLIDKKVVLSMKYEQLKTPEIHSTLIKPITSSIIELAGPDLHRTTGTPRLGPVDYSEKLAVSKYLVYVILLLRYEYVIQSEYNPLRYDLLVTKATVCEVLAIRMLREYRSFDRTNSLFTNPMKNPYFTKFASSNHYHQPHFNTLELAILSKSKKFLSQPIIVSTLDRFYNGELIIKDYHDNGTYDENVQAMDNEHDLLLKSDNIVDYQFSSISIRKVTMRANIVPKYQSIVINLKHIALALMYFVLITNNKFQSTGTLLMMFRAIEACFWVVALSLNLEIIVKLLNVEYKFLKKIIWTYIDMIIVLLVDVSFVLRVLAWAGPVAVSTYYDCFSLLAIILFPRILSIFNNYEFFHMIILSLKKMVWNMIGMFCLFVLMIFGFYLCFINLTIGRSNYDIAFDMVKLFFGFTPAVWSNWDNYNSVGKSVQMAYLFLIQFVIGLILAIVLSNVFARVNQANKEEFEYFKAINLVIYLKWGNVHHKPSRTIAWATRTINSLLGVFKFPIIVVIYFYELVLRSRLLRQRYQTDLKNFTFLDRETDYYGDVDLVNMYRADDDCASSILAKTRKNSLAPRMYSQANNAFAREQPALIQMQSICTMGNFRSASTDSFFIDEVLNKKYGSPAKPTQIEKTKTNNSDMSRTPVARSIPQAEPAKRKRMYVSNTDEIMDKLTRIEGMMHGLTHPEDDTDTGLILINEAYRDLRVQQYNPIYNIEEVSMNVADVSDESDDTF